MSNCDCQENIEDETSMPTTTADKELITFGDGLLITTVTSTAGVIFFGLKTLGVGQQGATLEPPEYLFV